MKTTTYKKSISSVLATLCVLSIFAVSDSNTLILKMQTKLSRIHSLNSMNLMPDQTKCYTRNFQSSYKMYQCNQGR